MMKTNNKDIESLIVGYLSNSLTEEELQYLNDWKRFSPENLNLFNGYCDIWYSSTAADKNPNRFNSDAAFENFRKRINDNGDSFYEKKSKQISFIPFIKYAAVAALLFTTGLVAYYNGESSVKDNFAMISVSSPEGSRTKLNLPDGSVVWLNSGSTIEYSQGFGVSERQVELNGEGYFEVKKNPNLPLKVSSENICVTVLGTKFNFKDYDEDSVASVVLLEGNVSLKNLMRAEADKNMVPNDRIILNKNTGHFTKDIVLAKDKKEWINGLILFDEEPLSIIVKELERSYDVKIEIINRTLKEKKFYLLLDRKNQTVTDALEVLSATQQLKYKVLSNKIIIYQ